ncbi:MAG: cytochrome c biogenesis protein CcdA [Flavobacteriaceae bacterium]
MKKLFLILSCLPQLLLAQVNPVSWSTRVEPLSDNEYLLHFEASIAEKWHLYSQHTPDGGALPTVFLFENQSDVTFLGPVEESTPINAYDPVFEMDQLYFDGTAHFQQKIKINNPEITSISGEIEYQACDDKLCIFRTEPFTFVLDGSSIAAIQVDDVSLEKSKALKLDLKNNELLLAANDLDTCGGYLNIFLLGLLGGILALLTPCVFPMIPLTVSYFVKQSASKARGTGLAFLYGFFIVLIYIILSLPFHFLEGLNPQLLNTLATNVVLNVVLFVVFVFFAFSFFGYYELTLPNSWSSKADAASQFQGVIGVFFMALTLALVSFSCTGPILGSLLAGSLSNAQGAMQLSVGMLGFGVALAFPFVLFALFPKSLDRLPKSGGWMTQLKVVLGFLELALALKFLSNADLVGHWGILKRELFIGIWLLLSVLLTLYLFGVIRFPHDIKGKLSNGRKLIALLALVFTAYLARGLFAETNTLKSLSGFPPPEFYSYRAQDSDCPLNLNCYKAYEIGLQAAIEQQKPILLDFTGLACVNCRKMEENVWSDPQIYPLLKDNVVLISLYVDDRKPLDIEDQFKFEQPNGSVLNINTVGEKWAAFQWTNFKTASQPYYILMTPDGQLLGPSIQYSSVSDFSDWLENGLKAADNLLK